MDQQSSKNTENSDLQENKSEQSSQVHANDHDAESTEHTHPHSYTNELASEPESKSTQAAPTHTHSHEDNNEHSHPHSTAQNNLPAAPGHENEQGHPHPHPQVTNSSENAQPHPHTGHDHPHPGAEPEHDHDHDHAPGKYGWLRELLPFGHGHSHGPAKVDSAMETDARGIWALKISLVMLGATAAFQVVVVLISGSVALLADTIHNFSDALTAIPLWIAFVLGRRVTNRRYTYGYGRVEDLAGVVIVLLIFFSALVAGYESYQKILNPQPITNVGWVIAAAIVGFIGNEAVAILRIRVGKEIGSAALVADGQHARVDGITSLAVLFGALGVLAGFPLLDPIVGLLITVAILFIVKDSALIMWHRLMDAIEPEVLESVEQTARSVPGVLGTAEIRVRWLGHKLQTELEIMVDGDISTRQSHQLAEEVRHVLFHAQPRLSSIVVHVNPDGEDAFETNHQLTQHHKQPGRLAH